MKRAVLLGMLVAGYGLPAFAGHGTIRETDTHIFVEYQGDAIEKEEPAKIPEISAQPLSPPPVVVPPPVATLQQTQASGKADEADPPATEARRDDPRRQKYESKIDQRAAQREQSLEIRRQQQAERRAHRQRKPGAGEEVE